MTRAVTVVNLFDLCGFFFVSGSRKAISQRNPLSRLENEALYERLKRAQRCRLEDQRGTEINTELPDFLKLPVGGSSTGALSTGGSGSYTGESHELPIDGRASEPILGCRPRYTYQVCRCRPAPLDLGILTNV